MMFSPRPTHPMIRTISGSFMPVICYLVGSGPALAAQLESPLTFDTNEPLDGLQKDADAQGEQEDSVEEGAEQAGSLPAKGQGLRRLCLLLNL